MIPKLIHQTFLTGRLPEVFAANVARLKGANPGWEHRLYDNRSVLSFISKHYGGRSLACYKRIAKSRGSAKADLFRYLLKYRCGGVYLDIKSTALRPLDAIVRPDESYILSQWDQTTHAGWGIYPETPAGEFQQWFIIARPEHPFLRAVISRVLDNIETYAPERDGVDKRTVFRLTGPIAYSQAVLPILDHYPHRMVVPNEALGLRYSILSGTDHVRFFRWHHTRNRRSIIRISWWRSMRLMWNVYRPLIIAKLQRLTHAPMPQDLPQPVLVPAAGLAFEPCGDPGAPLFDYGKSRMARSARGADDLAAEGPERVSSDGHSPVDAL
jgi:mannosyltransferase OCH1-like enzyme